MATRFQWTSRMRAPCPDIRVYSTFVDCVYYCIMWALLCHAMSVVPCQSSSRLMKMTRRIPREYIEFSCRKMRTVLFIRILPKSWYPIQFWKIQIWKNNPNIWIQTRISRFSGFPNKKKSNSFEAFVIMFFISIQLF